MTIWTSKAFHPHLTAFTPCYSLCCLEVWNENLFNKLSEDYIKIVSELKCKCPNTTVDWKMVMALSILMGINCITLVSQAAAELQQYCMQNACKDALLVGVPAGSNPFREPRSCALL
uniref:Guanine nucleotide-binding protein subunit gamma n=1 Tax=Cyanistes caeruleus TaxID=156563 RepID=A0A8C0TYE2_CYACU